MTDIKAELISKLEEMIIKYETLNHEIFCHYNPAPGRHDKMLELSQIKGQVQGLKFALGKINSLS